MQEPVPSPSASRGRIPPEPPTTVGLMEGPEWGPPSETPRVPWWGWLVAALYCLAAWVRSPLPRPPYYFPYDYTPRHRDRGPLDMPEDPREER